MQTHTDTAMDTLANAARSCDKTCPKCRKPIEAVDIPSTDPKTLGWCLTCSLMGGLF